MSDDNPYAPPRAALADVGGTGPAPALWNPNAAAMWSLVFSPAFGALVHMKNWQALGEPKRADASRRWAIAYVVIVVAMSMLTLWLPQAALLDRGLQLVGLALLVGWYIVAARPQIRLVAGRFGTAYPRRGWGRPMGLAVLAFNGFLVVLFALGMVLGALGVA